MPRGTCCRSGKSVDTAQKLGYSAPMEEHDAVRNMWQKELDERFARQVRAVRKERGITQRALSALTGLPVLRVTRMETSGISLRLYEAVSLAEALEVKVDRLVYGPEGGKDRLDFLFDELRRQVDPYALSVLETMLTGLVKLSGLTKQTAKQNLSSGAKKAPDITQESEYE
jgi:transcriptional regulator with XRE-family HTH domain